MPQVVAERQPMPALGNPGTLRWRVAWADEPTQDRLDDEAFQQMEDVELVLRFFAYRQKHVLHRGSDLRTYLDAYLRRGNGFEQPLLANMEALFLHTIETVERAFGERAFWLYRERRTGWGWFARPTTTVYDPLMRAVSGRLSQAENSLVVRIHFGRSSRSSTRQITLLLPDAM